MPRGRFRAAGQPKSEEDIKNFLKDAARFDKMTGNTSAELQAKQHMRGLKKKAKK